MKKHIKRLPQNIKRNAEKRNEKIAQKTKDLSAEGFEKIDVHLKHTLTIDAYFRGCVLKGATRVTLGKYPKTVYTKPS